MSREFLCEVTAKLFDNCASACRVPFRARGGGLQRLDQVIQGSRIPDVPAEVAEHEGPMTAPLEDRRIVVLADDKRRRRSWAGSQLEVWAVLLMILARDHSSWALSDLVPADVHLFALVLSLLAIPPRFRSPFRAAAVRGPCCYPSVQERCWHAGVGRLCDREGHSCVRKLAPTIGLRFRSAWRTLGRCLQAVIVLCGSAGECWSLNESQEMARDACRRSAGRSDIVSVQCV